MNLNIATATEKVYAEVGGMGGDGGFMLIILGCITAVITFICFANMRGHVYPNWKGIGILLLVGGGLTWGLFSLSGPAGESSRAEHLSRNISVKYEAIVVSGDELKPHIKKYESGAGNWVEIESSAGHKYLLYMNSQNEPTLKLPEGSTAPLVERP